MLKVVKENKGKCIEIVNKRKFKSIINELIFKKYNKNELVKENKDNKRKLFM